MLMLRSDKNSPFIMIINICFYYPSLLLLYFPNMFCWSE